DVTWSTGAAVRRRDAAGEYDERLSLDPTHCDLSQLIGGPVLDGHRADSVDRILGVVQSAGLVDHRGVATLQFSERAEPIWNDIRRAMARSGGMGNGVHAGQDAATNGQRPRTAVKGTPRKISLVPPPADVGAGVRGTEMDEEKTDPRATALERAAIN